MFLVDRRYLSLYYAITGHSLYDKCARDEWPLPFTFTPTVLLDLGIPLKAIMLGPGACAWVDGLHFVFKSLEYGSLSGAVGVGTLLEWFLVIRRRLLDPERHIDNHVVHRCPGQFNVGCLHGHSRWDIFRPERGTARLAPARCSDAGTGRL